jgi:hypothetical protein
MAFIHEHVLAQSHEDCSFCPRGSGASRSRTATCSSSRMSSQRTTLRTLLAALGLCVGAIGVWHSDSPELVRVKEIKARFGNVSSRAPLVGPGPAGFSLLCSAAGPCWMPRAGATNPARPSASTVAGACADTPCREWSVSGGAWVATCWCSCWRGAFIAPFRIFRVWRSTMMITPRWDPSLNKPLSLGGGLFIERTSPLASRKPSTRKPARLAII